MNITRRSAIKAAAWTTPAVVIATSAPAFATSPEPVVCAPTGKKFPGESWGSKLKHAYVILGFNCTKKFSPDAVTFSEGQFGPVKGGVCKNGKWLLFSDDSRAKLWVHAYSKDELIWEGEVKFSPAQQGGNKPKKK